MAGRAGLKHWPAKNLKVYLKEAEEVVLIGLLFAQRFPFPAIKAWKDLAR
jgi:hypothetical protein